MLGSITRTTVRTISTSLNRRSRRVLRRAAASGDTPSGRSTSTTSSSVYRPRSTTIRYSLSALVFRERRLRSRSDTYLLPDNENARIELRPPGPADAVVLHGHATRPGGHDRFATTKRKAAGHALARDMALLSLRQSRDESTKPRTPARPRPAPWAGPSLGREPQRTARLCAAARGRTDAGGRGDGLLV